VIPHFPETMLFHLKFPGKRDDVDDISSSDDLSTGSGSGDSCSGDSDSASDGYDSERERQLEREWEEGMRQLKLITTIVLLPLFGKWLGKKWAYSCQSFFTTSRNMEHG
jgi:hypothetical protein